MAVLNILTYPNKSLLQHAAPVETPGDDTKRLIDNMFETLDYAGGVGLAAPQVGVSQRVIVVNVADDPVAFVNPVVTVASDDAATMPEGCLSVPDYFEKVTRPARVTVEALDRNGKPFTLDASALQAACIQHEIDHLNGTLFIDHLSWLKRGMIRRKLRKRAAK